MRYLGKQTLFLSVKLALLVLFALSILFTAFSTKSYAFAGGAGTVSDPYLISTPAHLASLSGYAGLNQGTTYFRLQNNIDLNVSPYNTGSGWTPIGSGTGASMFNGHLDGNGFEVQNLYVNNNATQNVGLFGTSIGTITDLGVTSASVTSTLTATNQSGIGILVGRNRGSISNSYSTGTISSTTWMVGGLVGTNEGGYGYGSITESYSTATVSSQSPRTGGLVGENDRGAVVRSYATGSVSSTSNQIGGLAGILLNDNGSTATASISDSYSKGSVNGGSSVGGFVGSTGSSTSVTRSYVAGSVTGVTTPQAFAGSGGTVTNSYWDNQLSQPTTTSTTGTSQTTTQMKTQGTYSGWDFSTVWSIDGTNNDGYPYLQWQNYTSAPDVTTSAASSVTLNSTLLNGNVTDEGSASVSRQGFVWGNESVADPANSSPETSGYDTVLDEGTLGTGAYSELISSLSENTTYYYRAFAESADGIAYGNEQSFTTLRHPTVSSPTADSSINTLNLDFRLHSGMLSNSLQLVFDGSQDYTLNLANFSAGVDHSITIDLTDIAGSGYVTSTSGVSGGMIPDGAYSITFRYQDLASSTLLSTTVSDVALDATAPVLQSLSPVDNATGVNLTNNLYLTFNEPVGAASGDFVIYNADDDSVFETIPAGGGPISGNGTSTLTLNPFNDFVPGSEYYLLIDSGAIRDLVSNDYGGISDSSVWSFTALEPPIVVCEQPTSTHETASASCDTMPTGWGTTTWEARYMKASDSTYTDVTLANQNEASFTAEGLEPETDYYLEFRFDNDYDASPEGDWVRVEVTTTEPPQDDYNDDGIADYYQPNIGSYINPISGKRVVLDMGNGCELTTDDTVQEGSLDTQDPQYEFENGLFDFEAECASLGQTTNVKFYYYGVSSQGLVARKHNPNTGQFFNLSSTHGLSVSDMTIDGQQVAVLSYNIQDGGELDMDGMADTMISDPVGLAAAVTTAPSASTNNGLLSETGQKVIWALSVVPAAALGLLIYKRNSRVVKYRAS